MSRGRPDDGRPIQQYAGRWLSAITTDKTNLQRYVLVVVVQAQGGRCVGVPGCRATHGLGLSMRDGSEHLHTATYFASIITRSERTVDGIIPPADIVARCASCRQKIKPGKTLATAPKKGPRRRRGRPCRPSLLRDAPVVIEPRQATADRMFEFGILAVELAYDPTENDGPPIGWLLSLRREDGSRDLVRVDLDGTIHAPARAA